MRQTTTAIAGGALALALVTAPAAHAVVSKTGSHTCFIGEVVVLQAYGSGDIRFYTSNVLRDTRYDVPLSYWTYRTRSRSVNWKITSTGSLYDNGTKATCVDANIPQVVDPGDTDVS